MKKLYKVSLLALLGLVVMEPSYAQTSATVADIANALIPQLHQGVAGLLEALSYVFGVALGIKGVFKLKEHNESKGQIKLHTPIILIAAAAMFLSLPKLIDVGITTFGFDKGGEQTFKF